MAGAVRSRGGVREARRINAVLTAVQGFVAHVVATEQAPGELMPLIYGPADVRAVPAHARGEDHRPASLQCDSPTASYAAISSSNTVH